MNKFQTLIVQALEDCMTKVNKQIPQTKMDTKFVSIKDVKPYELTKFMVDNNIPFDADFDGQDNGYDGWDDIGLSWDIQIPTTDDDKLSYTIKRFNNSSFKYVHDALTTNGYKRIGCSSALLKEFRDTTVYDMYINKEYVKLQSYYSLFFSQKD